MSIRGILIRNMMKQMLDFNKPLNEVRDDFQNMRMKRKMKASTYLEEVELDGVRCIWAIPEGGDTKQFIFYLHGGGYCLGINEVGIQRAIRMAEFFGLSVVMIDYPLAPEYPFPCAIDKVNNIYKKLSHEKQVAVLGESAGCGLALNLMVHLREKHLPQPRCTMMLTPFLDATFTSESNRTMIKYDPFYVEKPYVIADYYTKDLDKKAPMVSPIFHQVHDLAPMLIHVAQFDTLSDDGTALYSKLKEAKGIVEYKKWSGMWHVFHMNDTIVPEAQKAMKSIKKFLEQYLEK